MEEIRLTSGYCNYPIIYKVLAPSQVVVWDFWTINSIKQPGWLMESLLFPVFFFERGSIDQVWEQVIFVYSDVLLVLSNNHHKTSLSLGGGFKDSYFHSYLGEWSILTSISQMVWNHQLELLLTRMPKEKKPWTIDFSLPTSSSKRRFHTPL